MGVNIIINDIDIVYRVFFCDFFCFDFKLIICKFVRRFVRNNVMVVRRYVLSVVVWDVVLEES